MDGTSPTSPLFDPASRHEFLRNNKAVVCAITASYISTFAGYPLDSIKSRLQTTKTPISIPRLAYLVYLDEGVIGFYRGLWIPLITISFVRAASFTIYNRTKEYFIDHKLTRQDKMLQVGLVGGAGGAMAGSLISFGSAPFELVKVRRQLEYTIAEKKGVHIVKPPSTATAVREIIKSGGPFGLYTGFRLHFVRDTLGTALYFFEYDSMRHLLGRLPSGEQGPTPSWLPIHASLVPFVCGSFSGVTSWALIYPLDVVKTKVQQRALAGERYRGPLETLQRLIRGQSPVARLMACPHRAAHPGPDPANPKPFLAGVARIYRGLGVSALRSVTTHGLLWTFFDLVANYIDRLPHRRAAHDD
ncbi:mitochondrial carrier [Dentipellis sp. KUC8613]|nr:mitochondrial carrier [Dentipellis sp. KUC8613]